MESAETTVKIVDVILTRVEEVKPCRSGGYWVHFEGSRESLHFDDNRYSVGDRVKITFEKVS